MKKLLLFLVFSALGLLAGCANTPISNTQMTAASAAQIQAQNNANAITNWYRMCLIYHGMQPQIAQKVATVSPASAQKVLIASHQATAVCSKVPTDMNSAAAEITQAVTTIGVLAAIPTN